MKKLYTLTFSLLFISIIISANDLYWVGGTGTWNDASHWAQVSGGPGGSTIPDISDNIHIDKKSLSEGDVLTISENITVNSISINTKKNFNIEVQSGVVVSIKKEFYIAQKSGLNLNLNASFIKAPVKPELKNASSVKGGVFIISEKITKWIIDKWEDDASTLKAGHIAIATATNPLCNGGLGSAIGSVTGGIGPFQYFWTGGSLGTNIIEANPINNLGAGTYTLIVIDNDDFSTSFTNFFINEPSVINVFFNSVVPSCVGANDGAIIANIFGGTPALTDYDVLWSNGFAETGVTASTAINLIAGPYSIAVTDTNGCFVTRYDTLYDPLGIDINALITDVSCNGFNDGQITTSPTSGNGGPFTFLWTPGNEITSSITNQIAGFYSVHVEDVNNCPKDTIIEIVEPSVLTASITSITHLICNGNCTPGEAIATPTGGTFPYTYQWLDAANNPIAGYTDSIASNLCAGSYSVSIIDANSCSLTLNNIVITEPPLLTAVSGNTPASCNGVSDGSVVVTPSGGTLPYSYSWLTNPGGISVGIDSLIINLPTGTYDYTVTDANNCVIVGSETISEPDTIGYELIKLDLLCNGDVNGQATVINVSGGDGNYNYLWEDAASNPIGLTPLVTNLIAGAYTITVSDGNLCSHTTAFDIIEPLAITLVTSADSVSCFGLADGVVHVVASGGTVAVDYTYDWRDAGNVQVGTTADVTGLPIGTYTVTVTDDNNCTQNQSVTIEEPLPLNSVETITDLTCNGDVNGAISIVISGGTPSYTTSWTGPNGFTSNNQNISGLEGGDYTITLSDANNCILIMTYTVAEPAPIIFTPTIVDVLCFGNATGSIQVTVAGGNGGYLYDWRDIGNVQISTTDAISNVAEGDYTLNVTDALGCTHSETYTISEFSEIFFNGLITPITCIGANDGAIDINPTGGTPGYSYSWTGPNGFTSTNQNISNLEVGSYTVTLTDQNLCFDDTSFILVDPPQIVITETIVDVICNGDFTGEISTVITGGVPPFIVGWTGPNGYVSTDQNIIGLEAGDYTLIVTDANSCAVTVVYTVDQPLAISIIPTITHILCAGDSTGAITVVTAGGNGGFLYDWRDSGNNLISVTNGISNVPAGDYTLTVTDVTGCTLIEVHTINEPLQALSLNLSKLDIDCAGESTGSAAVAISGGTIITPADYIIEWYDDSNTLIATTQIITSIPIGVYTVIVYDLNNCSSTDSIEVFESPELFLNPSTTDALCNGEASGSAQVLPSGGTIFIDYFYEWESVLNPGVVISTTNSINGVLAGDYLITVFDDNACSISTILTIGEPSALSVVLTINDPLCNGDLNGQVLATVSGGTVFADYSYEYQNDLGNTIGNIALITGLGAGNYSIIVTDDNNCSIQVPFILNGSAPLVFIPTIQQISCGGFDDGQISVNVSGETLPYTYEWTDAFSVVIGTDTIITNLGEGDYTFTVTTPIGCSYSETYTITPQSTVNGTYNQYILGDCSINPPCIAAAEVIASGGTGIYTNYQWIDALGNDLGINNDTATALCAGSYLVTITDSDGCNGTVLVLINDITPENITIQTTDALCNGDTGSAIAEYVCNDAPCTIEWYDALTNTSLGLSSDTVQLVAGDYFVAITNATGCTNNVPFSIYEPLLIIPNPSSTDVACNGDCDGTASVSPSGGTLPYTYLWDDAAAQTTPTAIGLCAGDYTVIITDANLCDTTLIVNVGSPSLMTVSETITHVNCQGGNDGIIDLAVSGGSGIYTYTWNPTPPIGNGTAIGSGLTAGDYTIDIEDANNPGCILSNTYTVLQADSLLATTSTIESTCSINDGEASVVVSGGTPGYTYLWNDGAAQTTPTAINLLAGIYTVLVTDANMCSENYTMAVNDQGADTLTLQILPGLCPGDSSTVSALYNCLNPTCVITWYDEFGTPLPVAGDIVTLVAGSYWIGIENGLSCEWFLAFEIDAINPIEPNLDFDNVSCNGPCDGIATINPIGGNGNYTITWIPEPPSGQGELSVSGLCPGLWQVIIEDNIGCDTTVTFEVLDYTIVSGIVSVTDASCNGDNSGSAQVIASGGEEPYTYNWLPEPGSGQGNPNVGGLFAGDWSVTIEDNNGCDTTINFVILEPSAMVADSTVVNASCNMNPGDGSIDLVVSGGIAPYTYQWFDAGGNDLGVTTSSITDLTEGVYNCVVVDDSLCTQTFVAIVSEEGGEDLISDKVDVSCFGGDDGMAWVEYICGDAPCTVNWYDALGVDIGFTTDTITNLISGSYIVGVTNGSGCISYQNIVVNDATEIVIDIAVVDATCSGICDGEAAATASGGTGSYTYLWSPEPGTGQGTALAGELCGGTWILEVTDDNGCVQSIEFEISEISPLFANIQIGNEDCEGDCNGWASIEPTGGTGDYSFLWSPEPSFGQGTDSVGGLCGGDWSVLITDLNSGCNLTEIFTVSQVNPIIVSDTVIVETECENDNTGSISITVVGGSPPYIYQWLDNNLDTIIGETDTIISDLLPGNYTISITDDIGCTHSEEFVISSLSSLIADAGNDTSYCQGYGPAVFVGNGNGVNSLWTDILGNILSLGDTLIIDAPVGNMGYIYQISDGICTSSDTAYAVVLATPIVDAGPDLEIILEESIMIGGDPTAADGSIFAWIPSESLDDSTLANPTANPSENTIYVVYVEDINTCVSSDTMVVVVKPKFIPNNGFTPNGDGVNDVWIIGDLSKFPNVEVSLFNRWGQLLFSSKGYTEPWDGMYSGKLVPVGTYYYVIDLKDKDYPEPFTGPLTIMR